MTAAREVPKTPKATAILFLLGSCLQRILSFPELNGEHMSWTAMDCMREVDSSNSGPSKEYTPAFQHADGRTSQLERLQKLNG